MARGGADWGASLGQGRGPVIEIERVSRDFGGFLAVDSATTTIRPAAIHAVVGENGAGKSTLLKLAAGVLAPTSGSVRIDGHPLSGRDPTEGARRGLGMVYQHFMLVGAFKAIENVMLGCEPARSLGRLDFAAAAERLNAIMTVTGLSVPLMAPTAELSVGQRQRLEILRVLYRGARGLLLDEPTAVLSPLEAEELYATLRRLADGGASIVVVTHRLDEVTRFADHVTVMRRGRVELSRSQRNDERLSVETLTQAIMGGDPPPPFTPSEVKEEAPVILDIRDLSLAAPSGPPLLDRIRLVVRAGEIVGVAGVDGNGQRELVRAVAGLEPRATGRLVVAGRDVSRASVKERREILAVVHEDRHLEGLLLDATVGDNFVLGDLGELSVRSERATIARRMNHFGVRPADPARLAGELSGGNQQKIVLGRELDRLTRTGGAAVLAQPTRGVDIGAAAALHRSIGEAAAAGLAVVVISADLTELRRLSHRIVVMRRGRIVAELSPKASEAEIGSAMLGGASVSAA